ncbi:hypothetical protein DQ384_05850 [Sphaerisporangium album]|uniref:EfeO-type cupredoxin-like domain-containing protein n=1 Tax=Sphaerisporangium album TaxID=509200 RepID=A0A367FNS6_9ACTN|nr:hypothetical protein [Sphaerisporangium album]RCG32053.1 hypothetical protein DQ384_05850 [Sphaerisporangium album]
MRSPLGRSARPAFALSFPALLAHRPFIGLLRRLVLVPLLGLAVVTGATACGSSGADAPAPTGVKEITVTIAARKVTPPPVRVDVAKGQKVRITVTSDVADFAHVHGYDKGAELKPGTPATIEFVADQSGLFEAETHDQELQLFQLLVR